jgi:hypothetical protein
LILGLSSTVLPILAWAFVVVTQLRNPKAFSDQGGMFITLCLFPLALLGALACGVPAVVLSATRSAASADEGGPDWRLAGAGLSALGLLLAVGTCVGPQMLATALR